ARSSGGSPCKVAMQVPLLATSTMANARERGLAPRCGGTPDADEAYANGGRAVESAPRAMADEIRELPTLQRLVAMFRDAMAALGKDPEEAVLERWAVLIHASMSG